MTCHKWWDCHSRLQVITFTCCHHHNVMTCVPLAFCWGNPLINSPHKGPVMRDFNIFVNTNKLLHIQLSYRFEARGRLCDVAVMINAVISQYLSAPMPTGIAIQKNDYFTKALLTVSDILPNIQKRVWKNLPSFFSLLAVYEYYSH